MERTIPGIAAVTGLNRVEATVFVTGVVSMGLEIVAGRIVAPAFGSSVYTWGSIIGVFLAALSLGYHRGGKRADAKGSRERMAVVLTLAAAYIGLVVLQHDLLLGVFQMVPVPPRFAALLPIVVLFGPPVYVMGFISPYAAALTTGGKGSAAGRVYALGTAGSIVGAFAATFVLIPWLGVNLIAVLFGVVLALTGAAVARPAFSSIALMRASAVVVLLGAAVLLPGLTTPGDTVYRTETPYQQMTVADRDGVRTMYLDGQPQSAMDLDQPLRHVWTYTRYFHIPLLFTSDVERVLFIGGGGFTGPRIFAARYNVTVDVVELDPAVVDAAERYFNVSESGQMQIHVADGRRFLENTEREYDIIILDAYRKTRAPFHLTTQEFFSLAYARLDPDGVLMANLISSRSGAGSKLFRTTYKTMGRVFPQVYAFTTADTPYAQNIELVATKDDRRYSEEELQERDERRTPHYNLSQQIRRLIRDVDTAEVEVLRDDHAAVDALINPLIGQEYVIDEAAYPE